MLKWFSALTLAILLLLHTPLATATLTALPPGYEDEILCHPGASSCLRPHPQPRGWCGPRTAFVECCDVRTGEVSRPRGWGVKLDLEYKERLLQQGWGLVGRCAAEEAGVCGGKRVVAGLEAIEGMVDRLLGMEKFGMW
jgi:hypothetical protein